MFSKKPQRDNVALVVDVGSHSVGAALVSSTKGQVPKILFSTRQQCVLPDSAQPAGQGQLLGVSQCLERVIKTIVDQQISAQKLRVVFSSPWYVSESKTVKIEYKSPSYLSRHDVEKLIKETQEAFVKEFESTGQIIEHRIIRTKVNGYETSDPYDKKAEKFELTFFVSIISGDILDSVRRITEKNFHIHDSQMSSFSLAAFSALACVMPGEHDYLMVDVRGEVTNISVVLDGALVKNLSFPKSRNALISAVADGLGQSPDAAFSLINLAFHDVIDPAIGAKVQQFANSFKQDWQQAYNKTLLDLSEGSPLPSRTFLLVDADIEIFFEKALNETKNNADFFAVRHLKLDAFIDPSSVKTDPFLALDSIFATII